MHRHRQARLVVGAGFTALALAACGGGGEEGKGKTQPLRGSTTKAPGTPGARPIRVRETEWKLTPATVHAKRGTVEIRAVNRGTIPHALEIEGPSEVKTGVLKPDQRQTIKIKLTKPGRYVMYCPVGSHRKRGMRGTVVVS
jgi:plastocyanin